MESRIFVLAILCFLFVIANGKIMKGTINNNKDDWVIITKFCFSNHGPGNLTWTANSNNPSDIMLLFYDDVPESWPTVYSERKKLSCSEKVAMSKGNRTIEPGVVRIQPFTDHSRPHYWYFVVANCYGNGINFEYNFEFINSGNSWERQFSFDEQGLAPMYLFYFLVFLLGIGVHIYAVITYSREGTFHLVVKIFSACVIMEFFYIMFMFIHYITYKNNGVGVPVLKGFAEVIDIAFQMALILLFILLAKGFAISKSFITDKLHVIILIGITFLLYISMFIWGYAYKNYGALYIYESAPGIIILILRVLTLGWFLWLLRKSHVEENHTHKKEFYIRLGIFCACWFLSLPFIVVIAAILSSWVRLKIVQTMYVSMNILALMVFSYLFWPSKLSEYFNVKTDVLIGSGSSGVSSPYETL